MLGEIWCTACMYSEPHGNVVRKQADATCSCFGQHVNKAQEHPMSPKSELGYMYRRDIHVKWQFYLNIWWILLSSNYHATLPILLKAAMKRYMIGLSGDTRTKLIGEIIVELHAIWWTYCLESTGRSYTFLVTRFWYKANLPDLQSRRNSLVFRAKIYYGKHIRIF